MTLFLTLVWAHLLLDYALQGDFMAKAKNEKAPINGVPWLTVMWSHAFLQAGPVAFLTGSWLLGICEFVAHTAIDRFKCRGWINFNADQALHIGCKAAWAALVFYGAAPMTALATLIARLEGMKGTLADQHAYALGREAGLRDEQLIAFANALGGDLNAAARFVEAELPGWEWAAGRTKEGAFGFVGTGLLLATSQRVEKMCDPAIALVTAALKARQAKEERNG